TPTLLAELTKGNPAGEAIVSAAGAAQVAAVLAAGATPGPNPPSSTFVCAAVIPGAVAIGWVGDSRAYWLPDEGEAALLTADDAVVTVTASGAAAARAGTAPPSAAQVIMVDCSGSMANPVTKLAEAKKATMAAIDTLRDGVAFAVVSGRNDADMVYPPQPHL